MARPAFQQAWEMTLPDPDGNFDHLKLIEMARKKRALQEKSAKAA